MGGKVFTALNVPRLPHEIYDIIRAQSISVLEEYYEYVTTPPEAPSKLDHGDVDFLVANPKNVATPTELAKSLGATVHKHISNSKTTHFAVPIPNRDNEYAQVDVHVCPPEHYHWEIFLQSYGDLLQIIGILNRPKGITINDKGLYVRIAEIEPTNKKKAMVFLTASSTATLEFLGLDVAKYNAGFSTDEEVFQWCAEGRFYDPPNMKTENANDRARFDKRTMFTTCIREWFPTHSATLFPPSRKSYTRPEVLEAALATFPESRSSYEAAMADYHQEEWEASVLSAIRAVIPLDEDKITEIIRGTKRFITYSETTSEWFLSSTSLFEDVAARPEWMGHVKTSVDKERFVEWIGENWEAVRAKERERVKNEKAGRMAAKMDGGGFP